VNGEISDHQQSWGYEDGLWKGPGPLLLVAADFYIFSNQYDICIEGNLEVLPYERAEELVKAHEKYAVAQ